MSNILEVNGLQKTYAQFKLSDVSFDVPRGYIVGFIGPNGAGKTTTIKLILNIAGSESGTVKFFGGENAQSGNSPDGGTDISKYEQIGVVMDTPMYSDDWSLIDVENAISPFYPNWNSEQYASYLKRFGLDEKKKVKELSRGMKVKLQIAVALSHDAKLLILDEPTSGLDPVAREDICDLLREYVTDESKSVIFSTHITSDLEKTADYITFIQNGSIVYTGSKDDLLEKYVRIAGGIGELSTEQKSLVIGYKEHSTGFEGMVETADIGKLPRNIIAESITLDEIIIFINKEGRINEQD